MYSKIKIFFLTSWDFFLFIHLLPSMIHHRHHSLFLYSIFKHSCTQNKTILFYQQKLIIFCGFMLKSLQMINDQKSVSSFFKESFEIFLKKKEREREREREMRSPLCMKLLSSPIRQCFVTKRRMPSGMMLRFVRVRKGEDSITRDSPISRSRPKGKGVWLHPACLNYAMRHDMFERAFRDHHQKDRKVVVPEDLVNRVVEKLRSDFYRALSEAKNNR